LSSYCRLIFLLVNLFLWVNVVVGRRGTFGIFECWESHYRIDCSKAWTYTNSL
jgi:hypothetical protein